MRSLRFTCPGRVLAALALALASVLAGAAPAGAYGSFYQWKTAINGSADDATKWNPGGVPNFDSFVDFSLLGTYTVTFPAGVATTSLQGYDAGNVTVIYTSPHTTGNFYVGSSSTPNVTCNNGVLTTGWVVVGGQGGTSTLTLTRTSPFGAYAE